MGKNFVHNCELGKDFESISSDLWKNHSFKYIYRKLFLISADEKHRKIMKMSQYGAEKERQRHLQTNPKVIHPLSMFRYYWEVFMVCVFLLQLISLPRFVLANEKLRHIFTIDVTMNGIINSFCMIDFFLNFVTGRFDKNKHIVILEPKTYIKCYCFTYAFPDFISSFPFEHFYYLKYNKSTYEIRTVVVICKFFHIFRLMSYLNTIREKREIALHKFKIFQSLLFYVLGFVYCIACIGLARVSDQNLTFHELSYKWCMIAAGNMIFGLEHDTLILYSKELIVHLVGRIFGTIIGIVFLAQMITFCLCTYKTKLNFYIFKRELEEYMVLKQLSPYLKNRVNEYQRFMYDDHHYNEKEIWSHISDEMKCNALYQILKGPLQSDIFQFCSEEIILLLIPFLRKRLLLNKDVLYRANTINSRFFFIHTGSVKILTEDDLEVAVLFDGKVFSDVAPIDDRVEIRRYTVVANENTEIYGLRYKHLFNVLQDYPDILKKITNIFIRRNELIINSENDFNLNDYYKILLDV